MLLVAYSYYNFQIENIIEMFLSVKYLVKIRMFRLFNVRSSRLLNKNKFYKKNSSFE